jgi:hypothetical protein
MERALLATHPRFQELERLGNEIAELSAHLDAATGRLLDLIREFDARGGWGGARSCADWLSWRVGLDLGAARERVRVARALGDLPLLSAALARGELSYSKVRALTRVATPETEARLLAVGRAGTAAHVEKIVRGWRYVDRQIEARKAKARHRARTLQVYTDEDGMVVVRGRLSPEAGAVLVRAIDAAREVLYKGARPLGNPAQGPVADPPTAGQQRADALALVAETALDHGLGTDPRTERYQVVVHVDAAALADPSQPGQSVLEDGVHVSAETSRRLACEATRVVMRHAGDGAVLDVGRRTRTIPPALRRALEARDRGCRFPGCQVRHAQGHHLHHWANGGPTRLANLALLCRRHHRAVHEEGYAVVRDSDGTLHFSTPQGWLIPDVPAPPAVPRAPMPALVATNREHGLAIGAWTACPSWLGERLDLGWAIDVLHPACNPAAPRPASRWNSPADRMFMSLPDEDP